MDREDYEVIADGFRKAVDIIEREYDTFPHIQRVQKAALTIALRCVTTALRTYALRHSLDDPIGFFDVRI